MKVRFRNIKQIEDFVKIANAFKSDIKVSDTAQTYVADGKNAAEVKMLGTGKVLLVDFQDHKSGDRVMFESQIEALGIVR